MIAVAEIVLKDEHAMKKFLFAVLAACLLVAAGFSKTNATAYSEAVRKYCRADYKKYCGEFGLETNALRNCMRRHGKVLSKSCVRALVQAGEVSQREVDRRRRTKSR